MNEFFNFAGWWVVVQHNWIWMLLAFLIGTYIGWRTCESVPESSN